MNEESQNKADNWYGFLGLALIASGVWLITDNWRVGLGVGVVIFGLSLLVVAGKKQEQERLESMYRTAVNHASQSGDQRH